MISMGVLAAGAPLAEFTDVGSSLPAEAIGATPMMISRRRSSGMVASRYRTSVRRREVEQPALWRDISATKIATEQLGTYRH
jgi:hypothetical protein